MLLNAMRQWRKRQGASSRGLCQRARRKTRRQQRLLLETLEDRVVPAVPKLTPSQVIHAYGIDQIRYGVANADGSGQTIAIIDPGDDSAFVNTGAANFNTSDLAMFDAGTGLPDPTSFTVVGETGGARPTYNASNIASATESGTTVTITTTGVHGFTLFEQVVISGVGVGGYNGSFQISSVTATTFTYTDTAFSGLASSSGGTATPQNPVSTGETALDVEWAHAIAPDANIVLIETSSGLFGPDITNAVNTAASIGASVVSMSFSGGEGPGETGTSTSLYDDGLFTAAGTTYVASTGDNGNPGGYPAWSPNVLAVGATNLNLNPVNSYLSEKGWSNPPSITSATESGNVVTITTATATGLSKGNLMTIAGVGVAGSDGLFTVTSVTSDTSFTYTAPTTGLAPSGGGTVYGSDLTGINPGGSGGGISQFEAQPAFQQGTVTRVTQSTTSRTTPDVSFVGGSATPVEEYDSFTGGFQEVAGTSVSAPCWAGLIALADQGLALQIKPLLDSHSALQTDLYNLPLIDFHDITSGYNGFSAGTGYDLVTGIGTPVANLLIPDLAGTSLEYIVPNDGNTHDITLQNSGGTAQILDNGIVVATHSRTYLSDVNVIDGANPTAAGTTGTFEGTLFRFSGTIPNVDLVTDSGGSNTVNIQAVAAGQTLEVDSLGSDTINVGNNGDLTGILGTVQVVNTANTTPATTVNIDDSSDGQNTDRTVTLDQIGDPTTPVHRVIFSGLGTIEINPESVANLNITGYASGNTFNVLSTIPYAISTLNVNGSGNTFNIEATSHLMLINDRGGNTINIGNQGSTQQIFGSVFLQSSCARPSGDVLTVDDSLDLNDRAPIGS
jgi:subtilase family serine protease